MHIDSNLIPLFAIAVGLIMGVTKILANTFSSYRLRVEQIRADAMVRAEEVRSRNQLELEKLMRQDQAGTPYQPAGNYGRAEAGSNPADGVNRSSNPGNPADGFVRSDPSGNPAMRSEPSQYEEADRNPRSRVRD